MGWSSGDVDGVGACLGDDVPVEYDLGVGGDPYMPASSSVDAFLNLRASHIAQGCVKLILDLLAGLPKLPLSTANDMKHIVALTEGVKDAVTATRLIVGDDHPTRWAKEWEKALQKH